MLDGDCAFLSCPPDTRIWWGAYLGTARRAAGRRAPSARSASGSRRCGPRRARGTAGSWTPICCEPVAQCAGHGRIGRMGSSLLRAAALTGFALWIVTLGRVRDRLRRRRHDAAEGRHHLRRRGDLRFGQRDHQADRAAHVDPAVHPHARPDPHRHQRVDAVDHRRGSPSTPPTGACTSTTSGGRRSGRRSCCRSSAGCWLADA